VAVNEALGAIKESGLLRNIPLQGSVETAAGTLAVERLGLYQRGAILAIRFTLTDQTLGIDLLATRVRVVDDAGTQLVAAILQDARGLA
jgi:hypothetical protein